MIIVPIIPTNLHFEVFIYVQLFAQKQETFLQNCSHVPGQFKVLWIKKIIIGDEKCPKLPSVIIKAFMETFNWKALE